MSTEVAVRPGEGLLVVEVNDPSGQEQVVLENIRPTATAGDLVAMAKSSLNVPPNVEWDLRDEATSRLLTTDARIGYFAQKHGEDETAPDIRVTMQPDAGLG